MTQLNPENFFDNVGGNGAPSAKLKDVDDFIIGTIDDQFMAPAIDFSSKKQKVDKKTGAPIEQLVIVLQTELRNWDGVSKIPLIDKDDLSSGPKPASEDDGRRAVYVEPWTNIHAAVAAAVLEATGQKGGPRNGGELGLKIIGLKDTGKGNPLKLHAGKYKAPAAAAAGDFFAQTAPVQEAPAQQVASQSVATPAPAAEQPSAPEDPWASPSAPAGQGNKPPF